MQLFLSIPNNLLGLVFLPEALLFGLLNIQKVEQFTTVILSKVSIVWRRMIIIT